MVKIKHSPTEIVVFCWRIDVFHLIKVISLTWMVHGEIKTPYKRILIFFFLFNCQTLLVSSSFISESLEIFSKNKISKNT